MTSQKEKNNKVIAAASTLGMYSVLFLILVFTIAWRAPYPPIPGGGGVELILGTDEEGFGAIPDEPIGSELPEQKKEEQQPDPQPEQPKEETKPVEQEPEDKEVVTSTEESPVTVKKEEPKKKEEKKTEPVKPIEKPIKEEPKKELPKTEYDPNKNKSTTDNTKGTPGNKGDDKGTTGDKGNPNGLPKGKEYEGNLGTGGAGKGGSGGVDLQMTGWEWVEKPVAPKATEQDQFSGQVVFVFVVDETGAFTSIKRESGNLSFELEKKCKEAIEKTSLYKISDGTAAPRTTGRVVFKLKVQ
jgi:protein TonB